MDDGFIFWPKHLDFSSFSICLNNLKFKSNSWKFRILSSDKLPRCISYTTFWPYYWNRHISKRHQRPWLLLPYGSAHPDYSKDNVPYKLAKRIIVFVSHEEKIEYRLNELKNWLKSWKYLEIIVDRAFRNARLQCLASIKTNSNNIPFVTTYFDNVNNNEKVTKIRRKFNHIQSDHLKNLLKNSNIVVAQKQPKSFTPFVI